MALTCRNRLALFFILMFGSCIVAGLFTGVDFFINLTDIWIYLSISLILFPFYLIFNSLDIDGSLFVLNRRRQRLINIIVVLGSIGTVISAFGLLVMLKAYGNSGLDVNQFKNGGYSREYMDINLPFLKYNFLLAPFGYLSLGVHFLCLVRGERGRSLLALLGAMSLLLTPLLHLARGGVILFLLLYLFYFVLVFPYLELKLKKRMLSLVALIVALLSVIFVWITVDRFKNYEVVEGGLIQNPMIYSVFNYMSQWMINGVEVIKVYTSEKMVFASNFLYIPNRIMQFTGVEAIDQFQLKLEMFGDYGTSFNGLPALLIYDFGILGAILFSWVYYFVVRSLYRSRGGAVKMLSFGLIIPVSLYFFQGVYFVFGTFDIALIYLFLFCFFYRYRL